MADNLYPLLFEPIYKDYIWGGTRIPEIYSRDVTMEVCAESWEISDRPEGMSLVRNGPLTGRSLHDLVVSMGHRLLGESTSHEVFPLLIKIIDAKQRLSVQVHPDDDSAAKHGGEAKTEMWYVLDAEPDAAIFAGLAAGTDADGFGRAVREERLEDVLCSIPARAGEAVYIPGGRVHAIGEGCLLLEVQQNSNTTYRVYDWGRAGADGRPRELHVDQAFKVIHWDSDAVGPTVPSCVRRPGPNSWNEVITCPYFEVMRLDLSSRETISPGGLTFHALFSSNGTTMLEGGAMAEELGPGTSCLVPAALDSYSLIPRDGYSQILLITGPHP